MKRFKGPRGTIALMALILMIVAYYTYLSNRAREPEQEEIVLSDVQEVLLRDLDRNYPGSPKEVVKYYSEITKCFYDEDYTEEELEKLSQKAVLLYDAELAAQKTEEEYLKDLKEDIAHFRDADLVVSSYKVSNSTDVDYFTKDGRQWASLYCKYSLRKGTELQSTEEIFILRKDEEGHWKIFGWDVAEPHPQVEAPQPQKENIPQETDK